MHDITKEMIERGLETGTIRLITTPGKLKGTVCSIGDYWFWFGEEETRSLTPVEYICRKSKQQIAREIERSLNQLDENEYSYYRTVIKVI